MLDKKDFVFEGWYQDENGEWCYDPKIKKRSESIKSSSSDKNKNAQMPSKNAMSDNNYYEEGSENYQEEGWYQDEYGNWLNQYYWKEVSPK